MTRGTRKVLTKLQTYLREAKLVRCKGCGKTVVGGSVIKMKKFGRPLKQIGGQSAGLIIDPPSSEVERNSLARSAHFNSAEAVQNLFDLVHAAFGQQE